MTDSRASGYLDTVEHVEEPLSAPLAVVNLAEAAAAVEQSYRNFVVTNVNNHCVRMSVMQGEFPWHRHPHSDECFLVLEGELEIEIAGDRTHLLKPGEAFTIPADVIHRTRARARSVNLCFETLNAYTETVFEVEPFSRRESAAADGSREAKF